MTEDDTEHPNRRAVLKKTGVAVAAGAIVPGTTGASPGNGHGGPGNGHGGPGNDNGPGGGPPFEDPDNPNIVFCGCSQVCVCDAGCGAAVVLVEDGPNVVMDDDDPSKPDVPGCVEVEEGRIVAVQDTGTENPIITCNPNRACGSFENGTFSIPQKNCDGENDGSNDYEQEDCKYGTAPQFGARCGDAFLGGCSAD